jgi:hypothetical protein
MTIHLGNLAPLVALVAGILILIMPRLLNYIVAIYLIVIGILGLIRERPRPPGGNQNRHSAFYFNHLPARVRPARDFSFEAH